MQGGEPGEAGAHWASVGVSGALVLVRERAHGVYRHPHMCTHAPAPLSAEQSGRDHVTTSLLSTSVCSLSDDGHWTLKG